MPCIRLMYVAYAIVTLIYIHVSSFSYLFFFNDTATTEIYTLSLHDALPIWRCPRWTGSSAPRTSRASWISSARRRTATTRSEEHTSELQSHSDLVCRLLLEKKKKKNNKSRKKKIQIRTHEYQRQNNIVQETM